MGLTSQSTGIGVLNETLSIKRNSMDEKIIALGGNPNVGKSTVFNGLTGLNQHTGNWPGKTVTNAQGRYTYKNKDYILVDIPGTYSLMSSSTEEEVARDFICFGKSDATIIVADATCLERNLNLVLQTLEINQNVVVCVNLLDEAERKRIKIDLEKLSQLLGVPVIGTCARNESGLNELMDAVYNVSYKHEICRPIKITYDEYIERAIEMIQPKIEHIVGDRVNSRWVSIKLIDGELSILESLKDFLGFDLRDNEEIKSTLIEIGSYLRKREIDTDTYHDKTVSHIVEMAEGICSVALSIENDKYNNTDRKIDAILTSKRYGIPVMLLLMGVIFWLTITVANYPSALIAALLFWIEDRLNELFLWIGAPTWVQGILVMGMYRTLAWVVSVMLPPMAIFFPLFTLLEDLGYLPRIAFNLDNFFRRACTHGKQALTMCMGFGCNASGVIGCRIIDSPRERLIATITNSFVPCNGRFPTLIAISTIFIGGSVAGFFQSFISTITMVGVIVLSVFMTLTISKILSKTILKGLPSSFMLELPPYRKPKFGRIIINSLLDRTLFVLSRSVMVAAPAGMVIWAMANVTISDFSLLTHAANFLQPFGHLIGLDGYILLAFILGLPANEIVVPIIIMSYMSGGNLTQIDNLNELRELLVSHGWTWLTAVCMMLFTLMHFPCATTLWVIKKETQSLKWTWVSFLVPTVTGITICFVVTQVVRLLRLV